MELFSEVYGCYYTVISTILEKASFGITKDEIYETLNKDAFFDTSFHMVPKLFLEWGFLYKKDNKYYSKIDFSEFKRPLTNLEKSWLKTLLLDKRILLFISNSEIISLLDLLKNTDPLFYKEDFHIFEKALDGDNYDDEIYRYNFKKVLNFCKTNTPLLIEYEDLKDSTLKSIFIPWKICYSQKDDKFRLLSEKINGNNQEKATLDISKIKNIEILYDPFISLKNLHAMAFKNEPIVLEISEERNALERCMLQFASWEKETEFNEEKNRYLCKIYYDKEDESELLMRILGFGPVIKVLGPESFLKMIKDKINAQYELFNKYV